jgi:hypothetical protein
VRRCIGESQTLVHAHWQDDRSITDWVSSLPMSANSGDIYALRAPVGAA